MILDSQVTVSGVFRVMNGQPAKRLEQFARTVLSIGNTAAMVFALLALVIFVALYSVDYFSFFRLHDETDVLYLATFGLAILYAIVFGASYLYQQHLKKKHARQFRNYRRRIDTIPKAFSVWILPVISIVLVFAVQVTNLSLNTAEQTPSGQTPSEQALSEQAPSEQAPSEQALPEQAPAEQALSEQAPPEQTPAEQTPADQLAMTADDDGAGAPAEAAEPAGDAPGRGGNDSTSDAKAPMNSKMLYRLSFTIATALILLMIGMELSYAAQEHQEGHRWIVLIMTSLILDFASYLMLFIGLAPSRLAANVGSIAPLYVLTLGAASLFSSYFTVTQARITDEFLAQGTSPRRQAGKR